MIFGGDFLVSNRNNGTIFSSLSIYESGLVLILMFSSGSIKEECMSFVDGKGGLDK